MSKRPWTTEKWEQTGNFLFSLIPDGFMRGKEVYINKWQAAFTTQRSLASVDELTANALLASKSPEMAELLIDLVRIGDASIDIDVAMVELNELYEKAKILLKEVGYDANEN